MASGSLARQPLAGKEGLDTLRYSSCVNAKVLAGPIRFVIAINVIYDVKLF